MIQRVNGSLAVSRALGDFEYKNVPGLAPTEQLVSPEPDVYVVKRDPVRFKLTLFNPLPLFRPMTNFWFLLVTASTTFWRTKNSANSFVHACWCRKT